MAALLNSWLEWLAAQPAVESAVSYALATSFEERCAALAAVLITWLLFIWLVPKARLATWGFWYFFLSKDKQTRKPNDAWIDYDALGVQRKKVVFIRHGESAWNAVFNKGSKLLLPVRLTIALIKEALMLFDQDSLFIDSPLSQIGIDQAWDLLQYLAQPDGSDSAKASLPVKQLEVNELIAIIRGDHGKSMIVSSNLRRAISTGLISLSTRLLKTSEQMEKIILLTHLQEISRNVDTLALTPEFSTPQVPAREATWERLGTIMTHFYKTRLYGKKNTGNKTFKQTALKRQWMFTSWLFDQPTDCMIVCGHSIYFREFFKSYLPKSADHDAKNCKMTNCGVVAFDFYKKNEVHRIDPDSIKVVHGGFEKKGKDKKKKV